MIDSGESKGSVFTITWKLRSSELGSIEAVLRVARFEIAARLPLR
jgi:hypothetical protein